ncbi:hypothetical protein J3R80_07110 [Aliiroseovarius sp. Z3]|uniref:hypothetical protein n=1 Tax=Aliiroseovarius sp. Z3 TaxID=2811402 RepID=UPI0023B29478|nr:hypothetical protein [Aliiroseovarius sp. Z3]MDE9450238.1 hypothetical protein [Aliiroseovarius sp. Z3]
MTYLSVPPAPGFRAVAAIVATPAVLVFLSSNFVNVGNLAFNMIFSRLMGPEMFGVLAFLLTITLALFGVLGTVQMSVSQLVASSSEDERPFVRLALSRINRILVMGALVIGAILTGCFLAGEAVDARLLSVEPHLLVLLLAAVPFGASMSVLRGIAFGDMDTGRIVLSANVEMGVRLAGALLAWSLGFGLEGVVVAISLSIVAGWAVLTGLMQPKVGGIDVSPVAMTVAVTAIPFAILQVTQVAALDGDIFLAKALLSDVEAGYVAALSLFQRIQFFACFALASVLVPQVVRVAKEDGRVVRCALPVYALFGAVSVIVICAALVAPGTLVTLLAGGAYGPAASSLLLAVLAAALFTFNYLTATLLIAVGDRSGLYLIAGGALLQVAVMFWADPTSFGALLAIKAAVQAVTATLILLRALFLLRTSTQHVN